MGHSSGRRGGAPVAFAQNGFAAPEIEDPALQYQSVAVGQQVDFEQELVAQGLVELEVARLISGQREHRELGRALDQEDLAVRQILA